MARSPVLPHRQSARARLRLGPASLAARVDVTTGGLLAIGALVSATLLSTAVLVRVAVREGKRPHPAPARIDHSDAPAKPRGERDVS